MRTRTDKIDTETIICTSLKCEFYFRFLWPPSTESTLISFHSGRIFATIRGKICPPQSQNCQNRTLHISKIGKLLPVRPRSNSVRNNHISERHAKFGENRQRIADVIVRQPIGGQRHTHTNTHEQKPKWLDSLSKLHLTDNKQQCRNSKGDEWCLVKCSVLQKLSLDTKEKSPDLVSPVVDDDSLLAAGFVLTPAEIERERWMLGIEVSFCYKFFFVLTGILFWVWNGLYRILRARLG